MCAVYVVVCWCICYEVICHTTAGEYVMVYYHLILLVNQV
jgi:hypothetical protein